eukprot:TRINITY_DN19999_c0_g1_i2.p1 TRINITY_DN19999_c0_g1~~TRINITY_DN19999_c0_g1_i2.p1  ORF type:complete len:111 (-),score=2.59 TRINITY_DN19999_c0_g1_i2:119-451(-)
MDLAYLVMLAIMSFNVRVLIAAVIGHAIGFLIFGSRVFNWYDAKVESNQKNSNALPPIEMLISYIVFFFLSPLLLSYCFFFFPEVIRLGACFLRVSDVHVCVGLMYYYND